MQEFKAGKPKDPWLYTQQKKSAVPFEIYLIIFYDKHFYYKYLILTLWWPLKLSTSILSAQYFLYFTTNKTDKIYNVVHRP